MLDNASNPLRDWTYSERMIEMHTLAHFGQQRLIRTVSMYDSSGIPKTIDSIDQLEDLLSQPDPEVVQTMLRLPGDVLILGAGGKMGPTLARMVRRAVDAAGDDRRVIAVSRYSQHKVRDSLQQCGVEVQSADLLADGAIENLPEAANVLFLAGMKFGTSNNQARTWAMNTLLPGLVARRFSGSRIVAFSTGNVYPLVPVESGGAQESTCPEPLGEYAMSCLGRERMFEHYSEVSGNRALIFRLNYACETRYGVLVDLALAIQRGEPVDLRMGFFNVIWQRDANALAIRCLEHCESPANRINISGSQTYSVRSIAEALGERLGRQPKLKGCEETTAYLSNTGKANRLFGPPHTPIERMLDWVADWVRNNRPLLGKATRFQVRDGKF